METSDDVAKTTSLQRLIMPSLNETLQWRRFCNVVRHFHRNSMATSERRQNVVTTSLCLLEPFNIEPSSFVTFVCVNCDHNPETLFGVSFRCTNGIIIRLPNKTRGEFQAHLQIQVFHQNDKKRRRSFQAVFCKHTQT